eukprot:SAG31_NODE_593_length_13721_cov_5.192175_4_plen_194_part_00
MCIKDFVAWQLRKLLSALAITGRKENSPLRLLAYGSRCFISFREGYLQPALCRWRPCQESAALFGPIAASRSLRIAAINLIAFVRNRSIDLDMLQDLSATGHCKGLEELYGVSWPQLSVAALGGLFVGLLRENDDQQEQTSNGVDSEGELWLAAVLTGQRLEIFAEQSELASAEARLADLLGDSTHLLLDDDV